VTKCPIVIIIIIIIIIIIFIVSNYRPISLLNNFSTFFEIFIFTYLIFSEIRIRLILLNMDSENTVTPEPIWSHLNVVMQSVSTVISPMHLTMFLTSFFFASFQALVCLIIMWTGFEAILPADRRFCGFLSPPPPTFLHHKVWCFSGLYPWALTVEWFDQLYLRLFL
jgi:hypothetical protein